MSHRSGLDYTYRRMQLDLGKRFYATFGIKLAEPLWSNYDGLDVFKLDELLEVPEGVSTKEHIRCVYGDQAVTLVEKLLKAKAHPGDNAYERGVPPVESAPKGYIYIWTDREAYVPAKLISGDPDKGLVVVEYPKGRYSVTHVQSGLYLVRHLESKNSARDVLAKALDIADWNGTESELSKIAYDFYIDYLKSLDLDRS